MAYTESVSHLKNTAGMARDDSPASSTEHGTRQQHGGCSSTAAQMRDKVGSEFET